MRSSLSCLPSFRVLAALTLVACGQEAGAGATAEPSADAGSDSSTSPFPHLPADGAAAAAGLTACDPLAAATQPIALGTVSAVGQAPDGTLYVAASLQGKDPNDQVFVSNNGTLQRKREVGSGSEGGGADADLQITFESGATTNRLVIKRRSGSVVGMALANDSERTFFDDLSSAATQLTVVATSRVEGLPVQNLSGETVLEFSTHVSDGSQLVVTRPRDDWSYESFRIFYGRDGTLSERAFGPAGVSRGSSTWLDFWVDGAEYTAVLKSPLSSPGPSTLTTPAGELTITLDDTTRGLPAGLTFLCLQ